MNLKQLIYNYPTKYQEGFVNAEIDEMLEKVKKNNINFNQEKFDNSMMGHTCMMRDGETITYHTDVYYGLLCGIENRDLTSFEWD